MQGDRGRTGNSERTTTTTTAQERDSNAPLGSYGGVASGTRRGASAEAGGGGTATATRRDAGQSRGRPARQRVCAWPAK